ncbi:MAG: L-threonylcarbamoyladenylate synthase [Planctomycetota bacterium]
MVARSDSSLELDDASQVAKAIAALRAGQLVGLPTETVYGLAARGDDADAVQRIFAAKGRPASNPLILHVADVAAAEACFSPTFWDGDQGGVLRERFELLSRFWPGPITLVGLKHERIPSIVTAGLSTVGVRVPQHPLALKLLRQCEFPLAAPSANPSNYVSPTKAEHVRKSLGDRVAVVLDGGDCDVGVESTIVDLGFAEASTSNTLSTVRILRPGGVTLEQIRAALPGHAVDFRVETNAERPTAPGQFAKHYSPQTPVVLVEPTKGMPEPAVGPVAGPPTSRVLRLALSDATAASCRGYADVWSLSSDGDPKEVARRLYAMLRLADESGFDRIDVETGSHGSLGEAILDRLRRCASPAKGE